MRMIELATGKTIIVSDSYGMRLYEQGKAVRAEEKAASKSKKKKGKAK